ncbi:hypothetical protein [Phaeovulum sp.]|uniref:hypothetical protein n=1 Tax=Phaeovulum sp. TaxID=2934796 RepID=UPI0035627D54
MIRRLARLALVLWAAGSVALAGYVLAQHPFAEPIVDRTEAGARAALTRAIAATATPDWIAARLAVAVAAEAPLDVALYLDLARDQGAALPPELLAEAEAMVAKGEGWFAVAGACGACALDIASCQTLHQIGICVIPLELSPLGDLNALRRAAVATAQGDEVDELEAGLALAGLAGTALMLPSGGTSTTVKVGATGLRLARKLGSLPERLVAEIVGAASWARFSAIAGDAGRIIAATSPAETLLLLRHADDAAELARLARLAEVAGPDTRRAMEVLGKARAFRALTRLSDLAVLAVALLGLVLAQMATVLGALGKVALRRALSPRRAVAKLA